MEDKKIVGYVRSFSRWNRACDFQKQMIRKYCNIKHINCAYVFEDYVGKKCKPVFREWEKLLNEIVEGKIEIILVDTKMRLYNSKVQKQLIVNACQQNGVEIIEVGSYRNDNSKQPKVVIYHSIFEPKERTCVPLNDIDALYEEASRQYSGWEASLYLDFNNSKAKYTEMSVALSDCIVLVKSFFHITRHALSLLLFAAQLQTAGCTLISKSEGKLAVLYDSDKLLTKPLRIAVYDQMQSQHEIEQISKEKLLAFVACKTCQWEIQDIYMDEMKDKDKPELMRLIQNRKNYDVVLIDSIVRMEKVTNRFIKCLCKIGKTIYSLREGEVILYVAE
ncbi:recombinase family protein [Eubacterium ramulus]